MAAPIVALTSTTKDIGGLMRVRLNEAYVDAVRAAGCTPLVLPPLPPEDLRPVVEAVRGIVFTGGEDVDPSEYGAPMGQHTHPPHAQRDKCEIELLRLARARRTPTLAICRGIQVVNVALGGTLIQDIATECGTSIEHDRSEQRDQRVHDVTIDRDSKLADAVGSTRISVNSSHHQSIREVAKGLRVTARAPDGVIEAAEWEGDEWWMLAVQWHPEELTGDAQPWDRGVFRSFARQLGV